MDLAATYVDTSGIIARACKGNKNQGSGSDAFQSLLAQISQAIQADYDMQRPVGYTEESTPGFSQPQTEPQRPITRLKTALQETGQPLESLKAKPEDRQELNEALVMSGYSAEDAEEILNRATEDDGSINVGVMLELAGQYPQSEGPVFKINIEDRPLLVQALKDLGVAETEIRSFFDGLPVKDGQIVVSGLPKLLSENTSPNKLAKVDRSVLADLLQKIGLSEKDVNALLNRSMDSEGNTSAKTMLELLEKAAASQNAGIKESLEQLAQRASLAPSEKAAEINVSRMKAEVAQAMEKIDVPTVEAEDGRQDQAAVKQAVAEALENLGPNKAQQAGVESGPANEAAQAKAQQGESKSGLQAPSQFTQLDGKDSDPQGDTLASQTRAAQADSRQGRGFSGGLNSGGQNGQANQNSQSGQNGNQQAFSAEMAGAVRKSAAATTASRPLPAHVVRQVSQQIAQNASVSNTNFRLELKPAELGNLTIKLTVKDGGVQATMVAETAAAKQALEAGIEQLKQQLTQLGLRAERIEIMVNPDAERQARSGGEGRTGGQGGGQQNDAGGKGQATEASESVQASSAGNTVSGGLSVFA